MSQPRFFLDEHVNKAIQRQLRRSEPQMDVLAMGDAEAPPLGLSDPDLLVWLEQNGYILVTANRSSMPGHLTDHFAAGRHIPGLFWLRPGAALGALIEDLYLIWLASTAEEYQDRLLYLPL